MDDYIDEPEAVAALPQEAVHAYSVGGEYQGQIVATPEQLAELDMVAGDPPAPDMALLKAATIEAVKEIHAETLSKLTGDPTSAERDTWTVKEAAARAHVDATPTAAQTAMLTLEAGATGGAVDDLAAAIIAKAGLYYQLIGTAGGLHQKAKALIATCTTPDELDAAMMAIRDGTETAIAEFMAAMG